MIFGSPKSTNELVRAYERDWHEPTLDALSSEAVQASVGSERALRLQRLLQGAGRFATSSISGQVDRRSVRETRNGLYVTPIERSHDPETKVTISGVTFPIGKLVADPSSRFAGQHFSRGGGRDVIAVVVDSCDGVDDPARRPALLAHETVHAEQSRREGRDNLKTSSRGRAAMEAEGYDVQFWVLNARRGGVLTPRVTGLVEEMRQGASTVIDSVELPEAVTALNQMYGYVPDGETLPPVELAQWYASVGLTDWES